MSPYQDLDAKAYWRSGVVAATGFEGLYTPKFEIDRSQGVFTAGSCFAQHIARRLRQHGFDVLDAEPAPPGLTGSASTEFGYNMYSGRFGNLYTSRQLLQLVSEVFDLFEPKNHIWERDGRYFDALRPAVEPDGLGSVQEVLEHRQRHIRALRGILRRTDIFVFTLGLTETWEDVESGTVFPTAPGTIAGSHDPEKFRFHNLKFNEIYDDLVRVRSILRRRRPQMRFLFTVSPVPLTATASGKHVLAATVYSKSVLRAVAGQLADEHDDIDYYPSYEIIAAHPSRGKFFEPNLRSVTEEGVDTAMRTFLGAHGVLGSANPEWEAARPPVEVDEDATEDDVVCEEMLLESFAR
jgi:hypothetical protein